MVSPQSPITWNRLNRRTRAFSIDGTDKALSLWRIFEVCDFYRIDDEPAPFRSYHMTFSKQLQLPSLESDEEIYEPAPFRIYRVALSEHFHIQSLEF